MKDTNISDRISILLPGSCPRGGTWGCLEAKIKFRPAVCLLCYLLLNHWTKFNKIWCVSYSHEWGTQWQFFFCPHPLGSGQTVKYYYVPLNHWTKFSQIWCASYSHEWGKQQQICFWPRPLGRGQKVKYHLILITKSISKICIPNLCVFSHMKDIKHIRWDFHSVAWVMPQGWALRVPRWLKNYFFQTWSCGISNRRG